MANKSGNLSINSENIFPIIKKWLYSDHDIFLRELVSNGCDAITKLKKLSLIGEFEEPDDNEYKVEIEVRPSEKTITISDNGLGMTDAEVEEYINQIAFSGARDFLDKYKDKANEDQIIGHFGLGFYSAFMVSDKVAFETLSYRDGEKAVHWESEGGLSFSMSDSEKTDRGTRITLYLNDESAEFANEYRIREILDKYCSFMPVPIFLKNAEAAPEYETVAPDAVTAKDTVVETVVEPAKTEEKEDENGNKTVVEVSPEKTSVKIVKRPVPVNDVSPLWNRHPNECSDDDYKEFYRKVFRDFKEPLFWIHLNMDYPFNLKGILYFPKINFDVDSVEGVIKLYNNQVFIADNIKEVIPEFLMLLKGVIDCPDLPLNVSRSALQNDGFAGKISDYIAKKVADRLSGMCKTDREGYEKYWDDISPFIKYGCLKDEKFAEKMNDFLLFADTEGKYLKLSEYLEAAKEKHENTVFYVTDEKEQSQYVSMFRKEGLDAVKLTHSIDSPFIGYLEGKNENVKFKRIDSELGDAFREKSEEDEKEQKSKEEKLSAIFKKALGMEKLNVKADRFKDAGISSVLTVSEEGRRMQEMMKMYGMDMGSFGGGDDTLVLNLSNDLVKYVMDHEAGEYTDKICMQLYDLALLGHGGLSGDRMGEFIKRSNEILLHMAEEK